MIGYRKFAVQIFAVLAGLILVYLNKDSISGQFIQGGTAIINGIFELIVLFGVPQGGAAIYNRANIKAKQVIQANGLMKAAVTPIPQVMSDDAVAAKLGIPLDIDKLLNRAESYRSRIYNLADTKEIGFYFAYRDIGMITPTTSLEHSQQYYDKLVELAQQAWLSATNRTLGKGKGFSWDERDLPESLAAGYSPGCHALSPQSWARHFNLYGLYCLISNDIRNADWLETLVSIYPYIDVAKSLGANCTLGMIGSNAQELIEAQDRKKKK